MQPTNRRLTESSRRTTGVFLIRSTPSKRECDLNKPLIYRYLSFDCRLSSCHLRSGLQLVRFLRKLASKPVVGLARCKNYLAFAQIVCHNELSCRFFTSVLSLRGPRDERYC